LQLNVESKILDENGNYELIPLDNSIKLSAVINYLWIPLNPKWEKGSSEHKIRLIYSRKKKEEHGATPM